MPTACCNMRIWLQVPETGICPAETPEYYTVQGKTGKGVSYMSIREALIHMFTDDPVNWLKWALVFAVLIGGYFVAVPLYGRLSHGMSWERKRDIARSRNHIIKASIVKKWPSGDVGHYNWHAPTVIRSKARSVGTLPISSTRPRRPCICISTTSTIPVNSFPVMNTTIRTTRDYFFCRSSSCPGFWLWSSLPFWVWSRRKQSKRGNRCWTA